MSLLRNPKCDRCPLGKTAEHVCLLGAGGKKAMIIGEAPGHMEDDSGQAFVGKAGQLLNRLLDEAGLKRKDFYVTNAVHCRPPNNKTPTKRQIEACSYWLKKEMKHIKPKFVLLLGNVPLQACLGLKGIRALRGRPIEQDGIIYMPTYHPAYALRDAKHEPTIRADLANFKEIMKEGGLPKERSLNPRLVTTMSHVKEMVKDIKNSSFVSFDIETNGLYPFAEGAEITLWGVGTRKTQWSIPLQHPQGTWYDDDGAQRSILRRVVDAAKGCKMCAHNGKFDSLWTKVLYDVDWRPDFDTMLAHYILDENARHGLKELATVYLNAPNYDIDKNEKQGDTPLDKLAFYHAHDLFYTRKLGKIFKRELRRDDGLNNVFNKLVMPVANLFIDVQYEGVYINQEQYKKAAEVLRDKVKQSEEKMAKLAPGVNWSSPKQIGDLFFKKLKLPVLDKTATGAPSTSESVLKRLADMHEIPRELMNFRAAKQQLSFFIEGWVPYMVDSRIHPNFKIHGTVTGRPSCADPNLQQVPRDPFIRSLICAPPGWELIEADLSQAELRIAAELARERTMLTSFQTGEDVHWKTALREIHRGGGYRDMVTATGKALSGKRLSYDESIEWMLKAGPDKCLKINKKWKDPRKKAKAINFGYLYGMWWKKFVIYARDNYGVQVTDKEAEDSRKSFFGLYPGFEPWHRKQKKFAQNMGYVRTLTGRKRRLPEARGASSDFKTQEAQRQAINSPVQSFASDLNLMAAIQAHAEFDHEWFRIIGTVHDSVLMIVRKSKLKFVVKRMKEIMSHPALLDELGVKLSVPIVADASIGPWGMGKSEEDYFGTGN